MKKTFPKKGRRLLNHACTFHIRRNLWVWIGCGEPIPQMADHLHVPTTTFLMRPLSSDLKNGRSGQALKEPSFSQLPSFFLINFVTCVAYELKSLKYLIWSKIYSDLTPLTYHLPYAEFKKWTCFYSLTQLGGEKNSVLTFERKRCNA